jgi:hypothetical protein
MNDPRRANVAAAIVILLAGALSSVWVFLVPIFQAPDEPAHFDYAISIYSAHRLVRLSDGTPDWIVSPYTKYLMRASDFERIAWHSSMRASVGYGSKAYFARVDAGAPSLRPALPPDGRISYIVPSYPFGFYALEAVWMHAISDFTSSLVNIFFAARLLCVFLMMVGLYFNYRTAINLSVPPWTSVALTAAVGFFPLTSLVSSYVQPDNLAYTLVSATLFFATELVPSTFRLTTVVCLGLSLGLLAITKYQFFLSAAAPVLLLFAARLYTTRYSAGQRIAALAAVVGPTLALLAIQYWAVDHSNHAIASAAPTDMNLSYAHSLIALGPAEGLRHAVAGGVAAFHDCFVSGGCAATFWQVAGWVDTPIVILNAAIQPWIRAVISLTTIAVFVILGYCTVRNALRLLWIATRRHARAALNIALSDAVFNGYFCFVAIMLALYVVTDNAFGAEGRQWYPYIFPAFLCFVWYAPRALRKEHRHVSAVLAGALLVYVIAASGYALADVRQRYYGPTLPGYVATRPAPTQILPRNAGVLFPVVSAEYHVKTRDLPFAFSRGARLLIAGMSILPEAGVVPSRVAVIVDSHLPVPVLAAQYLFPVAEAMHSVNDGYSAFYATMQTVHLAEGAHTVAAYAQRLHDHKYDVIAPIRLFFLTEPGGQFSPRTLRALGETPRIGGSVQVTSSCRGVSSLDLQTRTISAGGVLYVSGTVGDSASDPYRAAWLLADGRPYPTRYDEHTRSFVGTIPTAGLALGLHQVAAYAVSDWPASSARISRPASFRVLRGRGESEFLAHPPSACSDPLKQMAGT